MDGLQTLRPLFRAALLGLTLLSGIGSVRADGNLATVFAACAGRYSAATEHLWLTGGDAGLAEARRDAFADLADAAPAAYAVQVMAERVAAKAAQSGLLSVATFRHDRRAAAQAAALLAACDRLIPGA